MNPDEKCAAGQLKVQRPEAALAAFGDESSPEKEAIEGSLIRARIEAKIRPVEERLMSCEEYFERSWKKLEEGWLGRASTTLHYTHLVHTQAQETPQCLFFFPLLEP